jgi:hypothetical protein
MTDVTPMDRWIDEQLPEFRRLAGDQVRLIVVNPSNYWAIQEGAPYPDLWRFEWSAGVDLPLVFEDPLTYYRSDAYLGKAEGPPLHAAFATQDQVFRFKARIVEWIDADTVEVHPIYETAAHNRRIRLKDAWIVEDEDDAAEHARILREQIIFLGDVDDLVWVANTRHQKTNERIEARVDRA